MGTVSFFGVKLEHAVSPRWGLGRCMTQPLEPLPNFMVDIAMYRVWVQRLGMSKMATTHIPDHPRSVLALSAEWFLLVPTVAWLGRGHFLGNTCVTRAPCPRFIL